jgi:hypothetical protein
MPHGENMGQVYFRMLSTTASPDLEPSLIGICFKLAGSTLRLQQEEVVS